MYRMSNIGYLKFKGMLTIIALNPIVSAENVSEFLDLKEIWQQCKLFISIGGRANLFAEKSII